MKKVDHTGRRFGRLKAIKLIIRRGKCRNDTIYLCRCDCGTEKQIRYSNLMSGQTSSCGCLQKELLSVRKKPNNFSKKISSWNAYKRGAKLRNYSWELSKDEFMSLIVRDCHFCGALPNPLNGIDRFDNNTSYILNNCVPCCKICNIAKSDLSPQDFEEWIIAAHSHLFEGDK